MGRIDGPGCSATRLLPQRQVPVSRAASAQLPAPRPPARPTSGATPGLHAGPGQAPPPMTAPGRRGAIHCYLSLYRAEERDQVRELLGIDEYA